MGDAVDTTKTADTTAATTTTITTPDVADTTKTDKGASTTGVDTSKFTQEDWDKIYSDQKLYQHSRFKELTEQAKKAKDLEKAQQDAENKRLADNKQFEELAKKHETRANELQSKYQTAIINNAIVIEAQKQGVIDPEAVTALINRSNIKVDENTGIVSGVTDAVKSLVSEKKYLVGKQTAKVIGQGSSPDASQTDLPTFKLSQVQNVEFYRKHAKEIQEAWVQGRVVDDIGK